MNAKFYKKVLFCFLVFLFGILPSFNVPLEVSWDSKRFFSTIFLSLLGLGLLTNKNFEKFISQISKFSTSALLSFFVILFIGSLSALFSNYPIYSFLEYGTFILLLIFSISMGGYFKDHKDFYHLMKWVLILMVGFYCIRFSINYAYSLLIPGYPLWPETRFFNLVINGAQVYPEPFLGFSNNRFLNQLQTLTLPIFPLLVLSVKKKEVLLKGLIFFLFSFWFMLVFASDVRGTMLASALSVIIGMIIFGKRIYNWLKVYLSASLLGGVFFYIFFVIIPDKGGKLIFKKDLTSNARLELWENAYNLFLQNPFLGAGPMSFAEFSNDFTFAHPHNFVMQLLAEWGLVVTLSAAYIFIVGFIAWIKFVKKNDQQNGSKLCLVKISITVALMAGFMHAFVSGVLVSPLSQIMMALIIGFALIIYRNHNSNKSSTAQNVGPYALLLSRILMMILVVFMCVGSYKTYHKSTYTKEILLEFKSKKIIYPRFWNQGKIDVTLEKLNDANNKIDGN